MCDMCEKHGVKRTVNCAVFFAQAAPEERGPARRVYHEGCREAQRRRQAGHRAPLQRWRRGPLLPRPPPEGQGGQGACLSSRQRGGAHHAVRLRKRKGPRSLLANLRFTRHFTRCCETRAAVIVSVCVSHVISRCCETRTDVKRAVKRITQCVTQ